MKATSRPSLAPAVAAFAGAPPALATKAPGPAGRPGSAKRSTSASPSTTRCATSERLLLTVGEVGADPDGRGLLVPDPEIGIDYPFDRSHQRARVDAVA